MLFKSLYRWFISGVKLKNIYKLLYLVIKKKIELEHKCCVKNIIILKNQSEKNSILINWDLLILFESVIFHAVPNKRRMLNIIGNNLYVNQYQ